MLDSLIDHAIIHQENIDFIQLVTWNDFGEGTMLEPTSERQFDSLIALSPLTKGSTDPDVYLKILELYLSRRNK